MSPLEHVAIQKIQGQRPQNVTGSTPLHQVPSGVVLTIEGIEPSCDPISNSVHSNHERAQSISAHVAHSTSLHFLSRGFSSPRLSFYPFSPFLFLLWHAVQRRSRNATWMTARGKTETFVAVKKGGSVIGSLGEDVRVVLVVYPFLLSFLSILSFACPFSCHEPCQPSADTVASDSPAVVLTAAISIDGFWGKKILRERHQCWIIPRIKGNLCSTVANCGLSSTRWSLNSFGQRRLLSDPTPSVHHSRQFSPRESSGSIVTAAGTSTSPGTGICCAVAVDASVHIRTREWGS